MPDAPATGTEPITPPAPPANPQPPASTTVPPAFPVAVITHRKRERIVKRNKLPHIEWERPLVIAEGSVDLVDLVLAIDDLHNAQALVERYGNGTKYGCFRSLILDEHKGVLRARWHGSMGDASIMARISPKHGQYFRVARGFTTLDE